MLKHWQNGMLFLGDLMLKKTQFQLIISYIVYYIYSKKYQNLLLSRGFIAWTRTNYKIELQITREKMGKTT